MSPARSVGSCLPALVVALGLATGSAHAQPKGTDPAAAEALFQRGVERLKKEDWASACAAFDASMKLDPSVGTQINVARCAEHDGRVASAWAGYKKAKALNAETPLEKRKANVDTFVEGEIKKLEPRLPWVKVIVRVVPLAGGAAAAPGSIRGLTIQRDDAMVPVEGLDVEVPIDPGKHTFTVSAPGYRTATVDVELAESGKRDVVLEITEEEPKVTEAAPIVGPRGPPQTPVVREDEGMHPALIAGLVVGSVGGAGLIVSAVTGGIAASDRATLDDLVQSSLCVEANGSLLCDDPVRAQAHDAITRGEALALTSTVTLFVGGGLVATGIVLIAVGASAGSDSTSDAAPVAFTPYVAPGAWGAVWSGSF